MKKLYTLLLLIAFAGSLSAQCTASFSLYDSSGTIYGINTSTGSATTTDWFVYDPSFNLTTYSSWDIMHTATTPGTYLVCIEAFDATGLFCDSTCQSITITTPGGGAFCAAGVSITPDTIPNGFFYYGSATGGSAPYTYYWDYGDGFTSTTMNGYHAYVATGTYVACLTITDATGCSNTTCDSVVVSSGGTGGGVACDANFVGTPDSLSGYMFWNISTGSGLSYYWDFGDGATSSLQNPYHTYSAAGTYTVCLSIWNGTCSDTVCSAITISGSGTTPPCNANFVWFPDSVTSTVYLWNLASGGPGMSYFWDFGDGNTSTTMYPMHTYATNGIYNVCLTVTDLLCTSTYCDSIWVPLKASGFTLNVVAPGGATAIEEQALTLTGGVIYPNPVQENANLNFTSTSNLNATVTISSIDGKVCDELQVNVVSGENNIRLNTETLSKGMYMVTVASDVRLGSYKFIKN
ncbi:MAG: PKD domain-containing protein [Flavobacteriales bacterium]|nr:PKD domain-containing protein [Flavobacteriales bacterium]